jgi:hypothetical protein
MNCSLPLTPTLSPKGRGSKWEEVMELVKVVK